MAEAEETREKAKKAGPGRARAYLEAPPHLSGLPIFSVEDLQEVDRDKFAHFLVIAADGVFEITENRYAAMSRKISGMIVPDKELCMGEGFEAKFPLISLEMFHNVISFFHDVYKEHKSEAAVILFMDWARGEWVVYTPAQEVSAGSVKYSIQDELKNEDAELMRLLSDDNIDVAGTIHSHAAMGAFHSGTDDDDEKHFDGLHITIGKFTSGPNPSLDYSFSFVVDGHRYKILNPARVVEGWASPFGQYPEGWIGRVSKKPIETATRTCSYDKGKFKCDSPQGRVGIGKCDHHDISKFKKSQMKDATSATLIKCQCKIYFKEMGYGCYKRNCKVEYRRPLDIRVFKLLELAELDPCSFTHWDEQLLLSFLTDLEGLCSMRMKLKKRIYRANCLVRKISGMARAERSAGG